MALEDPDIEEFTSEEEVGNTPCLEVESEEELGPTPIPPSSQEQEKEPAFILSSSQQQDADGTSVSSTQQHSIDGSQEELRPSQAFSPEDEVWMQQMDEKLRQCRSDLADLKAGRLDYDSGVGLSGEGQQHQVDGGIGGGKSRRG